MALIDAVIGASIPVGAGLVVWIGRQFVRSEAPRTEQPSAAPPPIPGISRAELDVALSNFKLDLFESFNGRYPSKEVFLAGMTSVKESVDETRKYIGDVKRDLGGKIDRLVERQHHHE